MWPIFTRIGAIPHQAVLESLTEYDLSDLVEALCQLHDAREIMRLIRECGVDVSEAIP